MKKLILILLIFFSNLYSSQIIFVVSKDFDSKKAKLIRYENQKQVSNPIVVNIGEKGLGWGLSNLNNFNIENEPIKKEGDKKAVAGIFKLSYIYSYHKNVNTKMPYTTVTKNYICVDDVNSSDYNKVLKVDDKSKYSSFEEMLLTNETYEYVIQVEHNTNGIKNAGSCIFIHVQNPKKSETTGCTSMKKDKLIEIIDWLDIKKEPILIQIPYSRCNETKLNFPFITCDLEFE